MKVVFRTDASVQIGTGHVMRCLTLADALAARAWKCIFICREHHGNLIELIRGKGHTVYRLPIRANTDADLAHSAWLGASQAQDAQDCAPVLAATQPDWIVVDHYALDARWEGSLAGEHGKLMVIDDLVDRVHSCKLLLDQTFGRREAAYRSLVPEDCIVLCGSDYAILRPEFAALRPYSLQRRAQPQVKHLLITMGGVDKDNVTAKVLNVLRNCPLPAGCEITAVMGSTAPWLADVQQIAQTMPWPVRVRAAVNNMAQLMADSDLVIGSAGTTSWERCCLGLPTILLVLAENQAAVAAGLARAGAARVLGLNDALMSELANSMTELCNSATELMNLSRAARTVTNGQGLSAVLQRLGA